jgi:hypothetical protein
MLKMILTGKAAELVIETVRVRVGIKNEQPREVILELQVAELTSN